ncbi:MAG: NAD(P)/FAD-dependent oxidoreductase [Candidatus Omnitrophica bacterium]|nr:NAD(P)/FAD-dependent oxidoreductase [Candidatus Omnitrophota bacterium]
MEEVDICIVGCGVIGLAVAAGISKPGRKVIALEKNAGFGEETSSRNSEVIHAGIYYPAGSLKARFCVEGRDQIYALSGKWGIPTKKLGKLIVATVKEEEPELEVLLKHGLANGVTDLRIISGKELKQLEPNVRGTAALYSPSTGILDSHRLMQFFLGQAQSKGADIVFNSPVRKIQKVGERYAVSVSSSESDSFTFSARAVVNAAGLKSHRMAESVGMDIDKAGYRLKFCKGEYFRVRGGGSGQWVKRLIYPVPNKISLGIHVTPDMEGNLRLGPSAHYLDEAGLDYEVDESACEAFAKDTQRFLPMLKSDQLVPDTAGIRPKLQGPKEPFRDFVVCEESGKGFPRFINLIGIDSPGLTSSPAIADEVKRLIDVCL